MKKYQELLESHDFLRVVCVGDSTTALRYTQPNWTDWLQFLLQETTTKQKDWRRTVINSGAEEGNMAHLSTYYTQYVTDHTPTVAVMSFGIGEMLPEFNKEKFLEETNQLLAKFERDGIECILWSPYALFGGKYDVELGQITELYKTIALEKGIPYVDVFTEFKRYELSNFFSFRATESMDRWGIAVGEADYIHCNSAGSYLIASLLAEKAFGIPLTPKRQGDFVVPNLQAFKHWG